MWLMVVKKKIIKIKTYVLVRHLNFNWLGIKINKTPISQL